MIKQTLLKAFPKLKLHSKAANNIIKSLHSSVKNLNTVIDVGANIGQFSYRILSYYNKANVYCFEPLPEAYGELVRNFKKNQNVKPFNVCLGSEDGMIDFFVNDFSQASSALKISENQKSNFPFTKNSKKIIVPVKRLDNLIADINMESPVLLKLDTQGFEKNVLVGCEKILSKVDYLLFETSFIRMYENEPLFDEMHDFVKSLGFEFKTPLNCLRNKNSEIMQMDVLYIRRQSSFDKNIF
jgi:FkbM family methyltransferase